MTTPAQIAANRRNASHSTGPRTPEGKARSAANALKHGIRAQAIVTCAFKLLGEDPAQFAALLAGLTEELRPQGPVEEMYVESAAIALWRQARLIRAEQGHIAGRQSGMLPHADNPAGQARLSLPDLQTLEKLTRYDAHLDRQLNQALSTLARLQQARLLASAPVAHEPPTIPSASGAAAESPAAPPAAHPPQSEMPNEANPPAGPHPADRQLPKLGPPPTRKIQIRRSPNEPNSPPTQEEQPQGTTTLTCAKPGI